ncbi:MAG: glutamate racemase [Saprospiraceae bacterium]|nr:glutamate racemase [Saprospiraceae bacterium]
MKIAFFDSGVGGLTVLYDAMQKLPHEQYMYYADTVNVPYGTKSKKQIINYVDQAVAFIAEMEPKALVIACNTATSVVIKQLRADYDFPIIGMEPAIKPALQLHPSKKVLMCATKRTIKEKKLQNLIDELDAHDRVEKQALQKLVKFAEAGDFDNSEIESYLTSKFNKINWNQFGSVVLGCTHFLYFKELIQRIIPDDIDIIDGNAGTVNRLIDLVETNEEKNGAGLRFYESGKEVEFGRFETHLKKYAQIRGREL